MTTDPTQQPTPTPLRDPNAGNPPAAPSPQATRTLIQPLIQGTLTFASAPTQATVGTAGAASALPATPTGYLQVNIGNNLFIIPYYAPS